MNSKKVLIIFGTRPETIKMAPVIAEFRKRPRWEVKVCFSGQHREMAEQVFPVFGIQPDFDLAVMKKGQSLFDVTTAILRGMEQIFKTYLPDIVLVQGDTTTVLAASLAAFYRKVSVGHIEAGLRTGSRYSPYPEEMNRLLTTRLSNLHFAPTELSRRNLLKENIADSDIFVTGNTVIDALFHAEKILLNDHKLLKSLDERFAEISVDKKMILITGHRRENHGDGILNICAAIRHLAERQDIELVYPVHPNPNIHDVVARELAGFANVHLIQPLDYLSFLYMMRRSFLVMSDSGGVQEEAPSLGKPVLVMRESTERPEALEAGTVRLVGADTQKIIAETELLLDNPEEYRRRCAIANPFGDGKAAERIADILEERLCR